MRNKKIEWIIIIFNVESISNLHVAELENYK